MFTESVGPRRTAAVSLSGACQVFSLYDSVVPNVCDSTAATCSAEGGVHSALHFPAIFVKGDLTPLFYCNKGKHVNVESPSGVFVAANPAFPFTVS